jgi:hypothetical protein
MGRGGRLMRLQSVNAQRIGSNASSGWPVSTSGARGRAELQSSSQISEYIDKAP